MNQQQELQNEEGQVMLDPELKRQQEEAMKLAEEKKARMREINESINNSLNDLQEKFGLRIMAIAYSPNDDEIGLWKSKNVRQIDEIAFSKVMGNQF